MDKQSKATPNDLLQSDPEGLSEKLEMYLFEQTFLADSDCHALAEGSGFKAMTLAQEGRKPEAIKWAEIALRIYENLSNRNLHADRVVAGLGEKFLASAMNLRSELIGRYGEKHGDFIFDPLRLKVWFLDGLDLDRDSAKEMASKWRSLVPKDIQKLRKIKNRLKTLRSAMANGSLGLDSDLLEWKALERVLP